MSSFTLKSEAAAGPPCLDWLAPQERHCLLEAMLGRDDSAVVVLEAPADSPADAQVFWANPTYHAWAGKAREAEFVTCPNFWRRMMALPAQHERLWSTVQRGEAAHCPDLLSCGGRFFQATLLPLNSSPATVRFAAVLEDKTEQERATQEMRDLIARAHCLIWNAEVEEQDNRLLWRFDYPHLEATRQWLPIRQAEGQPFDWAWAQARLPEDRVRLDAISENALRTGQSSYQHESRLRLENGELCRVAEAVQIEPLGPGRWRLIGICTDITERKAEQEALREAMMSARCLVWHADVRQTAVNYAWEFQVFNEETALHWLPLTAEPGESFLTALDRSRFPEDKIACDRACHQALRAGQSGYSQTFRVRLTDGRVRWLAEDVQIEALGPDVWRLVGVCIDITERKQEQEALNDVITHARCLVWRAEVMAEGENMRWDLQVFNEDAARRWLALPELPGRTFVDAWIESRFADDIRRGEEVYRAALREGKTNYSQEYRSLQAGGQVRWLTEDVQIKTLGSGRWQLFGVCTDITERKALEEERERILAQALDQADRDPLTGLLNHRAFHALLAREADRALREEGVLGVAVIDLNNFKFFNDAYGHLSGDDVLRQVAAALRHVCRSYDTLARYGGDEFAVLMPGAALADVEHLAARLASCLDAVRYRPPGATSDIPLSLSVGMAVFPRDAPTPLAVLHLADERLLRVKSGERGNGMQAEQLRARLADGVDGFSMLDALVVAVDNKDRYTRSHSEGVLLYCLQIAEALGLEEEETQSLQVAALLHDVGKIGIPDHILRKPGRLTEAEYRAMKQHPAMGAAIVGAVPGLEKTLDAVRHHHEHWDGQGYPDGLAGEETPLSARIMAVADAYSAMTTDRPYRKGMFPEDARIVLAEGAGTQWDPCCVQAFLTAQRKMTCLKANLPLLMPQRA